MMLVPTNEKELSSCKMLCLMRRIMIKERAHQGSYKPDRGIMWTVENNEVFWTISSPVLISKLSVLLYFCYSFKMFSTLPKHVDFKI